MRQKDEAVRDGRGIQLATRDWDYGQTVEMLGALGIWDVLARDCRMDALESFCSGKRAQFRGMARLRLGSDAADSIHLAFCCRQATAITDPHRSLFRQSGPRLFLLQKNMASLSGPGR